MTKPSLTAAVVIAASMLAAGTARGQGRLVDDEAVLAPLRARVAAGYGVAWLTFPGPGQSAYAIGGTGVNAEGAIGLSRGLEVGVRFGLRLDDAGRGLRADEVARGFETATYGTGLSTIANPELRLRWRVVQWRWLEAGLDERFVFPTSSAPDVTQILGAWLSTHAPGVARADVGIDGVLSWQKFATGYQLLPAFGMPVRIWVNPTRGLFAGAIVTSRYYASTPYTTDYVQVTTGVVVGYRVGPCDASLGAYLLDVVNSGSDRRGIGVDLACRFGRQPHR